MTSDSLSTDQLLFLRTFRSTVYSLIRRARPEFHLHEPRLVNYPTPLVRAGLPPLSHQEIAFLQGALQPPSFLSGSRRVRSINDANKFEGWPRSLVRASLLRAQFFLALLIGWSRRSIDLSCAGFYIQRQWLRWVFHIWLGRSALAAGTQPIIPSILRILSHGFRAERRFFPVFLSICVDSLRRSTGQATNLDPPVWMLLSPAWSWATPSTTRWVLASASLSWKIVLPSRSTRVIWARLSIGVRTLDPLDRAPPPNRALLDGLDNCTLSPNVPAARLCASFITIASGLHSLSSLCDRRPPYV